MMHVPGFECHECMKIIFPDDHVLGCSKCEFFFHLHCTNLKEKGLEPTLAWRCHHCPSKPSELENAKLNNCHLCAFEAGKKAALDTHLLSNHCPDIAAQCDVCDKRFSYYDNLLIHMQNHHAPKLVTFEQTPEVIIYESKCKNNIEHKNVNALKTCKACETSVNQKELFVTCDNCKFNFHKKCTEFKKAGGHWKPIMWKCQSCKPSEENINASGNIITKEADIPTVPPKLAAKHRKSNAVACEHPEKEFLESQINTLKSIIARREAELIKIQESDSLKAKKIILLEGQLDAARKAGCISNNIPDKNNTEKEKIAILEKKTNYIENQISVLFNKFENSTENITTKDPQRKVYACHICDLELSTRKDLKEHMDTIHSSNITTHHDGILSTNNTAMPETQRKQKHSEQFRCQPCNYSAQTEKELEEHAIRYHWKCRQCSYRAIHNKDMRRHIHTMHSEGIQCNQCHYKSKNNEDFQHHFNFSHNQSSAQPCYPSEFPYQSQSNHEEHNQQQHKQRTRIFSSSRLFPPQFSTRPQTSQQEGMFRPWASSSTTSNTASSSTDIRFSIPRPSSTYLKPNNEKNYD